MVTAICTIVIYFIAQVVTITVIYLCSPPTEPGLATLFLIVTINNVIVFLTGYLSGLKKILEKDIIEDNV